MQVIVVMNEDWMPVAVVKVPEGLDEDQTYVEWYRQEHNVSREELSDAEIKTCVYHWELMILEEV